MTSSALSTLLGRADLPDADRRVRRLSVASAALPVAGPGAALVASAVLGHRRMQRQRRVEFEATSPGSVVVGRDRLTLFSYGEDLYARMLEAIRGAERRVLLETFIWKPDEIGRELKSALIEAAERGVEVFVIYDGFANLVVPPSFFEFPPAVHVMKYPTFAPGWKVYDPRRYGRDHRKILCVDDRIGFVGGYNIGSLYARHWRDTQLCIDGPSSWQLRHAFAASWNARRRPEQPRLREPGSRHWVPAIRAYRNAPREKRFPIRDAYLEAIAHATERIWLSHAYFVPDHDILRALIAASGRGVDVQLLLPGASNHPVMDWLAHRSFTDLLEAGIKIFLFQDAMIHTKTTVIDGQWATVGTANIDRMSLIGNYEINVEVVDSGFARLLERSFLTDRDGAREVDPRAWSERAWPHRAMETLTLPLRHLL